MFDQKLGQNHPHTTPAGRAISALNHPSSFRKVLISVHLWLKSFSFSYMFTGRIPPKYEWLTTEPLRRKPVRIVKNAFSSPTTVLGNESKQQRPSFRSQPQTLFVRSNRKMRFFFA
jgi:hypothetical protein